jgi:hypothetical protein
MMVHNILRSHPQHHFRQYWDKPLLQQELLQAIDTQNKTIVTLLLDYGADPVMSSVQERQEKQRKQCEQHYHRGQHCECREPQLENMSPLISMCAAMDAPDLIKRLIARGCDVNAYYDDSTPLGWALYEEHPKTAQVLLQHGASVNLVNEIYSQEDWTPLMLACQNQCANTVRMLLQRGANTAPENDNGWQALHIAAQYDQPEIIQLLLQYGVDPHAVSRYDYSPLTIALIHRSFFSACTLVSHGAIILGKPIHVQKNMALECKKKLQAISPLLCTAKGERNHLLRTFLTSHIGKTSQAIEDLFIALCDGSTSLLPEEFFTLGNEFKCSQWDLTLAALYHDRKIALAPFLIRKHCQLPTRESDDLASLILTHEDD